MTSDLIVSLFTVEGFTELIKWLVVLLEGTYLMFAFILVFEVKIMNRSFHTIAAPIFMLIALAHLGATIAALLISITLI